MRSVDIQNRVQEDARMEGDHRVTLLGRTEILRPLSHAALSELLPGCQVVRLAPGEILFESGSVGDSLYVIETGRLEIYLGDTRLDEAGEGESLGEVSLFTDEPRAASVRAIDPTLVLQVSRESFRAVLERHPQVMTGLLRDMAGKMKSSIRVRVDQHRATTRLREAFARSVSAEVMEKILARQDPFDLLDGEENEATVLFADIRSFTSVSESLSPKALLRRLNGYVSAMVDVILAHAGTLDKFLGDGIMALFGVPLSSDRDAARAISCAYEMQRCVAEHNASGTQPGDPPLRVGIGLATGLVVAGCVGTKRRMEYTAIGDVVNLSSRLEGLTKVYETPILVSGATALHVGPDLLLRLVDRVRAKGKSNATDVHDVLGPPSPEALQVRGGYASAYAAYAARRFGDAQVAFEHLAADHSDGPSRVMAARCKALLASAPPASWDGVFALDHK